MFPVVPNTHLTNLPTQRKAEASQVMSDLGRLMRNPLSNVHIDDIMSSLPCQPHPQPAFNITVAAGDDETMLSQHGRATCWVGRYAVLPCDAQLSRGFVTPHPFQYSLAPDQSQSKHRKPKSRRAARRSRTQHPQRGRSSGGGVAAWYSFTRGFLQQDPVRPAGELIGGGKLVFVIAQAV